MSLEIKVTDDMKRMISDAILETVLGDAIKTAVEDSCLRLKKDNIYQNPISIAVNRLAEDVIRAALDTPEDRAKIRAAVIEAVQKQEFAERIARVAFRDE